MAFTIMYIHKKCQEAEKIIYMYLTLQYIQYISLGKNYYEKFRQHKPFICLTIASEGGLYFLYKLPCGLEIVLVCQASVKPP
jgi:hypothetical protein